jgi:hypothetical protein
VLGSLGTSCWASMGAARAQESRALLEWMRLEGFSNLGISGMSMGGVHAAMVRG